MTHFPATAVLTHLPTQWIGHPFLFAPTIGSTNDTLKALAQAGATAGTLLATDYQETGRGRLNRRWVAPAQSSLLLSILFRPDWPLAQANQLMMMGGLALVDAIRAQTGVAAQLKWPNDIVIPVAGGWHKAGGLLLETALTSDGRIEYAVLGMGLNVNIPAEQLPSAVTPATSLWVAGGRPVPRWPLLVSALTYLEDWYAQPSDKVRTTWLGLLSTIGQTVHVTQNETVTLTGVAESCDEWGYLQVRDSQGHLHTVAAGDVTLRPTGALPKATNISYFVLK